VAVSLAIYGAQVVVVSELLLTFSTGDDNAMPMPGSPIPRDAQ
jgi:hypothetical protein